MSKFTRNDAFFGRSQELKLLDDQLLPSQPSPGRTKTDEPKYFALCGMPGVGKTELALEFVHTRKYRFDAVFWIRADDKELLEFDLAQIAVELELNNSSGIQVLTVNHELAKSWLEMPRMPLDQNNRAASPAEATWLVILDNADEPDIPLDLKPISGHGSILVTSCDPNAKDTFSTHPMGTDLEAFSDQDGGQLLKKILPKGSEDEACEISRTLGGLPLAITQMAGMMKKQ